VKNLQKTYIEAEMKTNHPHLLKPAIQCVVCKRLVLWENKETKQLVPDNHPVYGIHKFVDSWYNHKIICENWITCPYLYIGLQQTLKVEIDKNLVLPGPYKAVNNTTLSKKMVSNKLKNYLEKVMPKCKCIDCGKKIRLDRLFGHMPFSSELDLCNYRLCQLCLIKKLRATNNPQSKSDCRLFCPKCNHDLVFYSLLGHMAKDVFKKKKIKV
jgi:hypothetical protein